MSNKPDLSIERKNQILDAAMETFTKLGFHKARMSDIAENSGLSKGSLYWYFESKDALIINLLDRVFEPEIKDLRALLTDERPTVQRLGDYIERGTDDIIKMLKWMPLVYDFFALAFRQKTIKEAISNYYKLNMDLLSSLIQQGIDAGEFQIVNAEEAAIAIGSIMEGTVILWFYDPENINIKTHIKSNSKLLIRGLIASPLDAKPKVNEKELENEIP